jgi:hypothetical protein
MKKFILFIALFVNITLGLSQVENHEYGTTIEEYNYVTRGYQTQIRQGLDMKAGYEFASSNGFGGWLRENTTGIKFADKSSISVQLELLQNNSKEFPNRAIMVIITSSIDGSSKYLCIPNNYSSKSIWDRYFDDIIKLDRNSLLALTWVMSKSKSAEILFCFPENSVVQMVNGNEKCIQDVCKGDTVLSYNFENQIFVPSVVDELIVHSKYDSLQISKIIVSSTDNRIASIDSFLSLNMSKELEATNEHPIITKNGIKRFEELKAEDVVLIYNESEETLQNYSVSLINKNIRRVVKVYNLRLIGNDNFFVNGILVATK